MCLQLFASSGLETANFADMEDLSNHMGLLLQVCDLTVSFCTSSKGFVVKCMLCRYTAFAVFNFNVMD